MIKTGKCPSCAKPIPRLYEEEVEVGDLGRVFYVATALVCPHCRTTVAVIPR
jgi:endogenous inhibitor of DNA gyrase (YacG/DUF329 family)